MLNIYNTFIILCYFKLISSLKNMKYHKVSYPLRSTNNINSDINIYPYKKNEEGSSIPSPTSNERKTFKRFMQVELWRSPELEALYPILDSLERACRDINRLMRRISTDNLDGLNSQFTVNIQGESQKKLDVIANRILKTALCCSGEMELVASEEEDEPCLCSSITDNHAFTGDFAAVFDPLDGSSNIDSGLPTGTIFGVYKKPSFVNHNFDPSTLVKQKGSKLVIAGYCLYSASTHLVITMRSGLHMFTLDDVSGEFYLTKSNIRIPTHGNIYSFNDAYFDSWDSATRYFVQDLRSNKLCQSQYSRSPTARYIGALVADVHNILMNGGVFGYPATLKNPTGKLRLVYEANPLAMVLEEAGGYSSDGKQRILDKEVSNIHERTPLFIGSVDEVKAIEKYYSFYFNK